MTTLKLVTLVVLALAALGTGSAFGEQKTNIRIFWAGLFYLMVMSAFYWVARV